MIETLRWLLVAETIGLAAFPIAYGLFPSFRDRGWGLAKPLGLVVFSFLVWMLSYLSLLPNTGSSYWVLVVVAAVLGGGYLFRHRAGMRAYVKREWPALLAGEALFLGLFLAWVAYRAYDPAISGTEKPMDLLFLNAASQSPQAPPADPWLGGQPVAYYYLGYWMVGAVGQMAAVPTFMGFNLGIALIAGVSAGAVFSIVYSLVRTDGARSRRAILTGAAGVLLLLVAANLTGIWEFGSLYRIGPERFYDWLAIEGLEIGQSGETWRPTSFWWWWRASRVVNSFDAAGNEIDFTIQEFPLFSLLLGDLHPHLMSIPFVLLAMGMIFQVLLSPARWGLSWIRRHPARALALAVVIGSLGFINAWDLPTLALLLLLVVTLKTHRERGGSILGAALAALPAAGAVVALGLLAFAPFYFGTFSSQVSPGAPIGAARHATRPIHFFTVWGLALLVVMPFLFAALAEPIKRLWCRMRPDRQRRGPSSPGTANSSAALSAPSLGVASALVAVPFIVWAGVHLGINPEAGVLDVPRRLASVLPLGLGVFLSVLGVVHASARRSPSGYLFALVLISLSLLLLYGIELIYVRDIFDNRMNTVFKTYYQVWIFLAVAGAYAIHYWSSHHARWPHAWRDVSRTAAAAATVLVLGSLYYPVAAAFSKADGFDGSPTLDGLAYIDRAQPEERAAIEWLREHGGPDDTVLEAVGGAYSEYGRISASTGVPTVIGWPGHEHQWRGTTSGFDRRVEAVRTIYTTGDVEEARRLLDMYDITYVYIGTRERTQYSPVRLAKFGQLGQPVFEQQGVVIYRVQE